MTSLFIHILILTTTFAGQAVAQTVTTNGNGGDQCGESRVCLLDKASCEVATNSCVCHNPPYTFGDGQLNCYRKGEFRTEVTNDPRIMTFNNNSIDLPLPCRYLLTHIVTEYKDMNKRVVGNCEFVVSAFHSKNLGKIYVGGYDVAMRIECNEGSLFQMTIRKWGRTDYSSNYEYFINASRGSFSPDGPWYNDNTTYFDPKTDMKLKCKVDKHNNLVELVAKQCGVRIRFRPYDHKLRRQQPEVPGMAVAIKCAHHPVFESVNRVLAMPPKTAPGGFDIDSILLPGLGRVETLLYRAYMSEVKQNQAPYANFMCTAAKESLDACNTDKLLKTAFDNCLWILTSPRFIRCYDPSSDGYDIQRLFNKCVDVYCSGFDCYEVVYMIHSAPSDKWCGDVPGYPGLNKFVDDCYEQMT